eukprot:8457053-Alexandrium_andersonii.AAC.1
MSASLVGSEMCIRDRSFRMSVLAERPTRFKYSRSNLRSPLARPTSSSSCLLYTSDAADDM